MIITAKIAFRQLKPMRIEARWGAVGYGMILIRNPMKPVSARMLYFCTSDHTESNAPMA